MIATLALAGAANAQSRGAVADSIEQTRLRCGPNARSGDIALYGTVRDAASGDALDSVDVMVQWINITLGSTGIKRLLVSDAARSERGGHYLPPPSEARDIGRSFAMRAGNLWLARERGSSGAATHAPARAARSPSTRLRAGPNHSK